MKIIPFKNYNITQISSPFAFSFVLHSVLCFFLFVTFNFADLNQQTIKVSLAAPSSYQSNNQKFQKEVIKLSSSHGFFSKQKNNNKSFVSKKDTSGRQNEKSKELVAAESDPVFDAEYLNNQPPIYPPIAKKNNVQGKVLLLVLVNASGEAGKIEISKSSGSEILDEAAIDAVKNWKFVPAHRGDRNFQASVFVPIEFKII
jgi:TonB family protein